MSALAEALLAAQRQAIGAVSKAYVAGALESEGDIVTLLDEIGCTDKIEQGHLLAALEVLRSLGAQAPAVAQAKPSAENELETDAQRKLIQKLADERGTVAPDYKLTKANASRVIEELKAGTYSPDSWTVPV